jgi:uncharacterized protein (UPF0335 family)
MTEGHNNGVAVERLKSIIQCIERLEDERRTLASDIKDVYTEAKSAEFDVKAIRALLAERRKPDEAKEQNAMLAIYRDALAGWDSTPLSKYAAETQL